MNTISYNGKEYPVKEVYIDGEWLTVAEDRLEKKLFDENGNYISDEAKLIDEAIYCFVPAKKFGKADPVLTSYVAKNFF